LKNMKIREKLQNIGLSTKKGKEKTRNNLEYTYVD
jgi:hypothetical protein